MPDDTTSSEWKAPPADLHIDVDEVHLWRINAPESTAIALDSSRHFSREEVERAQRFHRQSDQERFLVVRQTLRKLLGRYLDCEPGHVAFETGAHGKPSLDSSVHCVPLQFNLSHAHELALIAISLTRRVGVDVEYMRDDVDYLQIARTFFSRSEVSLLASLPPEQRRTSFFRTWVLKEAYGKACGEGLSLMQTEEVSLPHYEENEILELPTRPQQSQVWSVREVAPGDGYTGAVVVEGRDWRLCAYQW